MSETIPITPVEHHEQEEMPFAIVQGVPWTVVPKDLYIPPEALSVFLETFEGPLDLLLYLIKRQNLDILDIPIAQITRQYMAYIDLMRDLEFELAAEYLVMAAMLAEIKSRMLLPRPPAASEEEDPRAELVRRLQEYERYKKAAEDMERLPRLDRDNFACVIPFPDRRHAAAPPTVALQDLLAAFAEILSRASLFADHRIRREPLSVRERMSMVLERLRVAGAGFVEFSRLFTVEEGRAGVVVTLLAILELLKGTMIELVQNEPFGLIYVKAP
jgi:segregation and condensation protein A